MCGKAGKRNKKGKHKARKMEQLVLGVNEFLLPSEASSILHVHIANGTRCCHFSLAFLSFFPLSVCLSRQPCKVREKGLNRIMPFLRIRQWLLSDLPIFSTFLFFIPRWDCAAGGVTCFFYVVGLGTL
jgi:hypothetical protein